jgi:hypothetical protein
MAFDKRWDSSFASPYPAKPVRRRRRWLEVLLILGFLVCLLIGLVALGVLWRLYNGQRPQVQLDDPLAAVQAADIVPQLALAELAGDPAEALAYQAYQAGELETGRTILLFTPPTSSSGRLAMLLQLAHYYAEAGETQYAPLLLQQAQALALLDGTLGSLERSQALIQIAEGLLSAGEKAAALDTVRQAVEVARQAPELLPAQRSQLFTNLRPLAEQLDDATLRQQIAELVRNPFLTVSGEPLPVGQLWSQVQPVAYSPELLTAIATRQQRARELVNRIAFTGGTDIGPEQAALAQALLAEDVAWGAFVGQQGGVGLPPAQQLGLLLDQQAWLLLKLRIASLGFGLSLVPDWETNRAAMMRELDALAGALDTALQSLIAAEPDPTAQATLRLEALHWLALQYELGYMPDGSPQPISQRLSETQAQLAQLGTPVPFPIVYESTASPPGFRIQASP